VRRALALPAAAACLVLAGCSPIVSITPAPQATAVACAGVIVRLPDQLGTAKKRETDAQATAAWGEPVTVSLRCGVTGVPPSSQCTTFEHVDWKVRGVQRGRPKQYVLTTYGRTPAVQVVLDPSANAQVVMPAISDAVAAAIPHATAHCTIQGDTGPGPSGTPSPSPTP
jgi:Protein of unknown function (DUF3515)